ncbi:aminotransferase-like domain-containing protein [Marinibacterium profundimaris]|uniref:Aminotransferase n=1 Tax=Marinibacterium profundimaris TaxID=1679460 RepID=A0A225NHV3_9RHOB|nr:PLP-dependent aminotransferase family protein [Marinibacterium profundimaris]OWU73415.1 aminotransferase [Marinibacterium profundimaris]
MSRPALARWLSQTNDVTQTFLAAGRIPGLINLAGGLPDPSVWPVDALAGYAQSAVADHPGDSLAYSPIDGLPGLRDVIAARFSRGDLKLGRENVMVTTGGMQALDLVGKVLLDQGDAIAAQSPAYLGALDAWMPRGPAYRPMRLDTNDVDIAGCMAGAKFAYTVPNFSNPSGRLVEADQRQELVAAAHDTGCWLVEDDPYGALYYDGDPLPRLLDLSAKGQGDGPYDGPVIYLGTLSKELAPGMRIGWVIAAPEMIVALTTAKQGSDMFTSGICQRMAQSALEDGLPEQVLPQIIDLYRARRDALCAAMAEHLGDLYDWDVPKGGMFVWAVAKDPRLNTDALMTRGLDHGVCISPSSVFDPEGKDHRATRLNFTLNPPEKLAEGVRRLAEATRAELASL